MNGIKSSVVFFAGLALSGMAWATNPVAEIQTNHGQITVELYKDKSPQTVLNFIRYTKDGFYNKTIFHRVIDGFMVQGGGFTEQMHQKVVGRPIRNEANNGLKNERGTLAMARTPDPHSATAQFFINLKSNSFLDHTGQPTPQGWGYAVFGKVTKGMEVIDAIAKVPTGTTAGHQNVPTTPVVIESIKLIED